ncbi:DnaB-like helicase N-terminal domain-containing protein, partial [Escherichia coli]|uniref:DnaB-like helicase N-terminal domain-containing protein n=3 Tax=Escherichia coli TaxID=562 RepID=UPI002AC800BF
MTIPVWRNDDLEGAVIGAFFLRGADPEVMDILATLPADVFSVRAYRDIYTGICRQARVSGVIDPVLLCNEMPELAPVITDTGRKTWVKSSLEHYVAALRRNAALRDAEKTLNEALLNRPGFPGECFICELRLPDHCFRWKHNKLFLLL